MDTTLTALLLLSGLALLTLVALAARQRAGRETAPLDILKARLARGDINVQEYERLRRLITAGPSSDATASDADVTLDALTDSWDGERTRTPHQRSDDDSA